MVRCQGPDRGGSRRRPEALAAGSRWFGLHPAGVRSACAYASCAWPPRWSRATMSSRVATRAGRSTASRWPSHPGVRGPRRLCRRVRPRAASRSCPPSWCSRSRSVASASEPSGTCRCGPSCDHRWSRLGEPQQGRRRGRFGPRPADSASLIGYTTRRDAIGIALPGVRPRVRACPADLVPLDEHGREAEDRRPARRRGSWTRRGPPGRARGPLHGRRDPRRIGRPRTGRPTAEGEEPPTRTAPPSPELSHPAFPAAPPAPPRTVPPRARAP